MPSSYAVPTLAVNASIAGSGRLDLVRVREVLEHSDAPWPATSRPRRGPRRARNTAGLRKVTSSAKISSNAEKSLLSAAARNVSLCMPARYSRFLRRRVADA